jgi:hypothetical protein
VTRYEEAGMGTRSFIFQLSRQLPAVLFLSSALVLLSALPLRPGIEPVVMGWVYAFEELALPGLEYEKRRAPEVEPAASIELVELTRQAHAVDFGGRSPLPRGCLADAVGKLGKQVASMRAAGHPILALDMDVTLHGGEDLGRSVATSRPLDATGAPSCVLDDRSINAALRGLAAQGVTVIALALERQTVGERQGRNKFIAAICEDHASTGGFKRGVGGIYFASAAVFSRGAEPLYQFPSQRAISPPAVVGGVALPRIYPSLGNLVAAARRLHAGTTSTRELDLEALTSVCRTAKSQASVPNDAVPLIDDVVFGIVGAAAKEDAAKAFEYALINFHQLGVSRRDRSVDRVEDLSTTPFVAPTVFLHLKDGSTADRFATPKSWDDFMDGAAIHAAISVSHGPASLASATKLWKLLADIAAGVVFCLPMVLAHHCFAWRSQAWAWMQRAAGLLLPACVAGTVIFLATWVSALALPRGIWLNPVYMALGMMLHAYFDATRPAPRRSKQRVRPIATSTAGAAISTFSDWVDVAEPPPFEERNNIDILFMGAWWLTWLTVVVVGWWYALGGAS